MLADDSVTAQNMGRKILADAGYEVITVNNGSAALKRVNEQKPDLIVLDVYMPGYSGLEVCQRLKESGDTARVPVLLTVGKLEPFKPEEAKRVHADAFIVKPFEASELLSALSKLEDRIVPRPEAGKPGRFARAIAAVEESERVRYEAVDDDDNGWKNRISFPKKKKQAAEQAEDGDDPAVYNAKNDDLRTVVEHKPAATAPPAPPVAEPEARVDVAAIATPGLPKDVTAEELAAIAAAAAKVQEAVSAAKTEPELAKTEGPADSTTKPAETESPTSLAGQSVAASPAASSNGNGNVEAEMPATMAVFSSEKPASRWTAVAVALDASEASLSLEQEMLNAAAVAVMDAVPAEPAPVASFAPPSLANEVAATPEEPVHSEAVAAASAELIAPLAVAAATPPSGTDSEAPAAAARVASDATSAAATETSPAESSAAAMTTEIAPAETTQNPEASATSSQPEQAPIVEAVAHGSSFEQSEPEPAETQDEPAKTEVMAEARAESSEAIEPTTAKEAPGTKGGAESEAIAEKAIQPDIPVQPETPAVEGNASAAETESAIEGAHDMAEKREKELAAKTAAAWASWRQIRENGDAPKSASSNKDVSDAKDEAAMAVAAGAEKAPEETAAEPESAEIASIVDSVLADLRPKIVEEISRKLGKKK